MQITCLFTDFPPSEHDTRPIDLPDPWTGPRTYAEDFYSGGDTFDPAASPSHLTPRDDTDAFLTPARDVTPPSRGRVVSPLPNEVIDIDQNDDDDLPKSSRMPMEETKVLSSVFSGVGAEHEVGDDGSAEEEEDEGPMVQDTSVVLVDEEGSLESTPAQREVREEPGEEVAAVTNSYTKEADRVMPSKYPAREEEDGVATGRTFAATQNQIREELQDVAAWKEGQTEEANILPPHTFSGEGALRGEEESESEREMDYDGLTEGDECWIVQGTSISSATETGETFALLQKETQKEPGEEVTVATESLAERADAFPPQASPEDEEEKSQVKGADEFPLHASSENGALEEDENDSIRDIDYDGSTEGEEEAQSTSILKGSALAQNEAPEGPGKNLASTKEHTEEVGKSPTLVSTVETKYTVSEVDTDDEGGGADNDDVITVTGGETGETGYTVEEPITEGRLTEVMQCFTFLALSILWTYFIFEGASQQGVK
jgi:hypothetical protein